ncbi:MAG: hypothetical protein QGG40_00045 [Myxococcota bacterium]|jgi:hypothetical protein|nr:hypothetical protein [Myxococcota bacterium]
MEAMGVVQGGWEHVIAAYAITWSVLILYGGRLLLRLRAEHTESAS